MKLVNKLAYLLIIYGIIATILLVYQKNKYQETVNEITLELENAKNKKPEVITIKETEIEYKYKDGKTVVKYVPPEGYVKFDLKKYNLAMSRIDSLQTLVDSIPINSKDDSVRVETIIKEIEKEHIKIIYGGAIDYKTKGFTFRPQIGIGYDGDVTPYFGFKYAFYNRYSLNVGSTVNTMGVGITRHIDDILPLKNTEIMMMYGKKYHEEKGGVFVGFVLNM